MDHNANLAEAATPVLEMWEAFDRAHPRPDVSPLLAYFRKTAFLAGMAGGTAKLLDGTAGFVYNDGPIAVACCPPLWPSYRDECCEGESDELLALQEGAFLAGMAGAFGALAEGADPMKFGGSIMAASLVAIKAEADRLAEAN